MKIQLKTRILRNNLVILFLLIVTFAGYAQQDTTSQKKNAIYFEMGGAGGSHSMNYERVLNLVPSLDLNLRGGFGFDNWKDYNGKINPDIVMPFMVTVTYGRNHKIEGGLGESFSNTNETDINTGDPRRMSNLSTTFCIGYRYQNPAKRLLIRAGYMPYIEFNERFQHWAGVSIGFIF
ncbi:MAG: hypothetical protein WCI92_10780 [Bacteroidota bacterium]